MHRTVLALAALLASAAFVPAAQAHDCSDADDAADVADCMRSMLKAPTLRQVLPPVPRPSASIKSQCDADDAEELKECLRGLKAPGVGRLAPPDARPVAGVPVEKRLPDRTEAAPATVASTERPARLVEPDAAALCQKYFPNVGQMVPVPCSE
jgi:hypothetical protein